MKECLLAFAVIIVIFWFAFLYWTAHPEPTRQTPRFEAIEQAESMQTSHDELRVNELTTKEMRRIIGKRDPFRRVK